MSYDTKRCECEEPEGVDLRGGWPSPRDHWAQPHRCTRCRRRVAEPEEHRRIRERDAAFVARYRASAHLDDE